jgi:uncharacterized protein HemY
MNHAMYVLLILAGGTGAGLLPFLVARHLVGQHGDPARAERYLAWFRAQRAAERARADQAATTVTRTKELAR